MQKPRPGIHQRLHFFSAQFIQHPTILLPTGHRLSSPPVLHELQGCHFSNPLQTRWNTAIVGLKDLQPELIFQICENLCQHCTEKHIDAPQAELWLNKYIGEIAQKVLFHHVGWLGEKETVLYYLLRTIHVKPDLGKHIRVANLTPVPILPQIVPGHWLQQVLPKFRHLLSLDFLLQLYVIIRSEFGVTRLAAASTASLKLIFNQAIYLSPLLQVFCFPFSSCNTFFLFTSQPSDSAASSSVMDQPASPSGGAENRPVSPSHTKFIEGIQQQLPSYAATYSEFKEMRLFIGQHFASRPGHAEVSELVPMDDEYEARLDAIMKIRTGQRAARSKENWDFSATQFTVLITMPLRDLRHLNDRFALRDMLDKVHGLFNHFLQTTRFEGEEERQAKEVSRKLSRRKSNREYRERKKEKQKAASSASSAKQSKSSVSKASKPVLPEKPKPKDIDRNDRERDRAEYLDENLCVVTQTARPEGCHIIPFAWNKNSETLNKTTTFMQLIANCFGIPRDEKTQNTLSKLNAGLGTSDRSWNVIFLCGNLHRWWEHGTWAFKWHGVLPPDEKRPEVATVQLQFVWLPRSESQLGGRRICLEEQYDPEKRLLAGLGHTNGSGDDSQCPKEDCQHCKAAGSCYIFDRYTQHPVISGRLVNVIRDRDVIDDFKVMVDLQWALLRAAAMSGAAGYAELPVGIDDDDDNDDANIIELWRSQVSGWLNPEQIPPEVPQEWLSQTEEERPKPGMPDS
ncbi:hypothetical protein NM208_g5135 [Fusarium decemcellulare]|uniref:Uncharacterized protein n=1 Tax=Fusarium decemcellulare TaxID=57161 RepID=A0ACC1SI15_9HYPO|nr:hypothetical protein NM208_g5135 [Fusarium decemcellulare]